VLYPLSYEGIRAKAKPSGATHGRSRIPSVDFVMRQVLVADKPLRWGFVLCTDPISPPVTTACLNEQVIPPAQQSERRRTSGLPPQPSESQRRRSRVLSSTGKFRAMNTVE
jgi:hypothetical protein